MSAIAIPPIRCARCGAPVDEDAKKCSVCGRSSNGTNTDGFGKGKFTITSLLLITTLVAVCMSMIVAVPGLGILMTIIALPPLVRTTLVVWKRDAEGIETDTREKVALFVMSSSVTFLVFLVVAPTAFLTFCFTCLGLAALGDGLQSTGNVNVNGLMAISGIVALVVSAGLGYLVFRGWIRRRWESDTSPPPLWRK